MSQLANEGAITSRLERALAGKQGFSYFCINFTDSSNRRGSARSFVNDQLLVDVGSRTQALLGAQVTVAKTSKDRLEVIIPGVPKPDAIIAAGRLREDLEKNFCSKMQGLGIAFGLATHPTDTDEKYNIRDLALAGVDEATKLGQNRIFAAISAADRAKDS